MKKTKSLIPKSGNDIVYTPDELANSIVEYFDIKGTVLEPCRGGGAFERALQNKKSVTQIRYCELSEGVDFMEYKGKTDWIVTNPPWSKFREFLDKACNHTNDIIFLVTINHFTTKKRLSIMKEYGFRFKEILLVDTPKSFPQSGFQVAAIHISKNYKGECKWNYLT